MKKLAKLKMPSKKPMADEPEMDMSELDLEEAGEGEGDMPPEDMSAHEGEESPEMEDMEQGGMADLEAVSDDDLMAEVEKRGLMGQLGEKSPMAEDEEELA